MIPALLAILATMGVAEETAATYACGVLASQAGLVADESPVIDGAWVCVAHDIGDCTGLTCEPDYSTLPMWESITVEP